MEDDWFIFPTGTLHIDVQRNLDDIKTCPHLGPAGGVARDQPYFC